MPRSLVALLLARCAPAFFPLSAPLSPPHPHTTPQALSNLTWAAARAGVPVPRLFTAVAQEACARNLHDFAPQVRLEPRLGPKLGPEA